MSTSPLLGPSSFARWGYEQMYASKLFYPSNCPLQKITDRGNIRASVTKDNLMGLEDRSWVHLGLKPIRFLARGVAGLAICAILAPVGVISNSLIIAKDGVLLGRAKLAGKETAVYKHAIAARANEVLRDLGIALFTGFVLGMSYLPFSAIILTLPPNIIGLTLQGSGLSNIGLMILFCANAPAHTAHFLLESEKRPAWLTSIVLRNDFGLVSKEGHFLKAVPRIDDESFFTRGSQFSSLYRDFCKDAHLLIQEIQDLLPINKEITAHFPPNFSTIKSHLRHLKARGEIGENENILFTKLSILENTMRRAAHIKNFMIASQEARDSASYAELHYQKWTYPFSEVECQFYFRKSPRGLGAPKAGGHSQEGASSYNRRWDVVKSTFGTVEEAWSILKIEASASRDQILAAWRKIIIAEHPDRNQGREAQANRATALATEAKDAMLLRLS